ETIVSALLASLPGSSLDSLSVPPVATSVAALVSPHRRSVLRALRGVCVMAACAASLCACVDVSMPAYQRPDTPAKAAWSDHKGAPVSATETIQADWWKGFQDPYLDTLIDKAIAGNFDIRVLAARIQVAGTQITEAKAGALPTMDLGAGADFEKTTGL